MNETEPFDRPFDYMIYGDSLLQAVKDADFEKVKRLLDAGTDVNFIHNGERPLILAAKLDPKLLHLRGHKKPLNGNRITEELIKRGADLNATDGDGNTAVYKATIMGSILILNTLLKAGADPNAGRFAPISEAVNSPREVALLLSKGADMNGIGVFGTPFIEEAIRFGNIKVINILYDHARSTGNDAALLRLRPHVEPWYLRRHAIAASAAAGSIRGGRRRKTKRVQRRAHKSRRNK